MDFQYTEEKLNSLDKETLIQLFLSQQEQLKRIDHTLQLVLEQMADLKRHRFGRSSERHETDEQISFMEKDGMTVFFNESEAAAAEEAGDEPEAAPRQRPEKKPGKRDEDLEGLLKGSLVSPSLEAAIMNAKYVNAVPLYRQEKEFERYGLHVSRQSMANWTIQCADRCLAVLYGYLHEKRYGYHVLQADETPVLVNKDGRPAGSKSYMWVYRTGRMYTDRQIVLYEYQRTRNASHPREFLKDFSGVCVTDGYQVYHTIENEREDMKIAGCWSHARRRFDEAVKALPKTKQKDSPAYLALSMTQGIYREEGQLKDLPARERQDRRQRNVRPLAEAYFTWVRENIGKVPQKSKAWEGFSYSLNQEKYLKVFLDDGEVPMDNNAAEQSIRGFCIGKKNWAMIDTVAGANSSAIIYSIAETAKANNLKPYDYFEYLLTELPKHLNDTDRSFLEDLLPWAPSLPANCRKSGKNEEK